MTRTAKTLAAVGIALSALTAFPVASADPLNPRDPDYCGNQSDVFFCTDRRSTYPDPGEMAFLNDVRGRVPGIDALHLSAGRASCLMLPSQPAGAVIAQVGDHLRISPQEAGEIVHSANANICPAVTPRV